MQILQIICNSHVSNQGPAIFNQQSLWAQSESSLPPCSFCRCSCGNHHYLSWCWRWLGSWPLQGVSGLSAAQLTGDCSTAGSSSVCGDSTSMYSMDRYRFICDIIVKANWLCGTVCHVIEDCTNQKPIGSHKTTEYINCKFGKELKPGRVVSLPSRVMCIWLCIILTVTDMIYVSKAGVCHSVCVCAYMTWTYIRIRNNTYELHTDT